MRYYKCKCGAREMWTTDGLWDCQGCEKCGTAYSGKPLEPHEWRVEYNPNTGRPYKICKHCYHIDEVTYNLAKRQKDEPPTMSPEEIDEFYGNELVLEIPPDDEINEDGTLVKDLGIDETIPKNLDEAIEMMWNEENLKIAREIKSDDEFSGTYHHGYGTGLRNGWGLWGKSPLSEWFNSKGIYHADDMSGIIMESFWRKANGKDIDLEGQIQFYRNYWDENNPDVNKGKL